jgi:GMP synthase-like glutamine amidotransferase
MAKVQILQHVAFEDPGSMTPWLQSRQHALRTTHLYNGELPPAAEEIDWLIIMGGPMGVHDEAEFAWLTAEKALIRQCIEQKKVVLGICLGAQLIADVLGASVHRNTDVEIGWFPISATGEHPLAQLFALSPTVFHWHGDTFAIPDQAVRLCRSAACDNQAFLFGDRVLGLQFHLEITADSIEALCASCEDSPGQGRWIQSAEAMKADQRHFSSSEQILDTLLSYLQQHLP